MVKIFFFFFCHSACRILLPQPGVEPMHPALEVLSPNHWTAREFPKMVKIWTRIFQKIFSQLTLPLSLVKQYSS